MKSIFLTDDDPDDQDFFSDALSELPWDIKLTLFENGNDLLKTLRSVKTLPDAVFLDLHLPMMTGEECLKEIRSDRSFDSLPVVIYSTISDEPRIDALFEMGANRYLQKPLSYRALVVSLKQAINSIERNPLTSPEVIDFSDY